MSNRFFWRWPIHGAQREAPSMAIVAFNRIDGRQTFICNTPKWLLWGLRFVTYHETLQSRKSDTVAEITLLGIGEKPK